MRLCIQINSLLVFSFICLCSSLTQDGLSLLALKAAIEVDPTSFLRPWTEDDQTPCAWSGVLCTDDRVTSLELPGKGLTGYIPSEIGLINTLKRLVLSRNNFSKGIPPSLFEATSLLYIDLSHNSLSGPIPPQIGSLRNLTHLDLSSNIIDGSLPDGLSELKSLTGTLNLSYNRLSGQVPESYGQFPVSVSLDLRNNNLTGAIPQVGSLLNQGPTAFAGNPGLCGFPLQTACPEARDPGETQNPENPRNPDNVDPGLPRPAEKDKEKNAPAMLPIISGISVAIVVSSAAVWLFRRRRRGGEGKSGKDKNNDAEPEVGDLEGQKGKFVVLDEGFAVELEDLLRASAYVVGKSRSGIVYKVVIGGRGSGVPATVAAVRRLSEGDATWKFKEFETEVEAIGRVQHPNIVRIKAFYYADDEKLLITDFIRNGSLYTALHGEPSDASVPLPWASRLKIAQGSARGLMYIHEYSPRKYVHGNIKSSKILLDDDLQPYVSGFGLTRLASVTSKLTTATSKKPNSNNNIANSVMDSKIPPSSVMYVAPEARCSGSKFTQKCDVYSFGVVLLELLTGQLPDARPENDGKGLESFVRKAFREHRPLSEIIDPALIHEVYAKKQVLAAFHIALNCTELDPELRPKMKTVSEGLDRIK